MTVDAHLRIRTGNEYNPWALFSGKDKISVSISNGEIGSKRNEDEGDGSKRRYSWKLCLHAGIADANLGPTVAKCVLSTFEISCAFVVTALLLRHLIEEIGCLRLFLLFIRVLIPSQIFFVLLRSMSSSVFLKSLPLSLLSVLLPLSSSTDLVDLFHALVCLVRVGLWEILYLLRYFGWLPPTIWFST